MADKLKFHGTVVRREADGFGVVRFANVVGDVEFGFFSSVNTEAAPFDELTLGATVDGEAELGVEQDFATIKSLALSQ